MPIKITATVQKIERLSPTIKLFEFQPEGEGFASFSAGSHISLHLDEIGLRRAYSLISDPNETGSYQIAVLLDEQSRGGSQYMHEKLAEGDEIEISSAENFFPLVHEPEAKHILIAGGIGITPFLSYLYELESAHLPFELHYCFRDGSNAAFLEELRERLGDRLFVYDNTQDEHLCVESLIQQQSASAHVYVCGPQGLIDAVIEHGTAALGAEQVHFENFGEVGSSGGAFEVVFQRSGFSLEVPEDMSIIQAIEADKRLQIDCLCRNGVCGTCETVILEGEAEHRDQYLDDEEQASQKTMMICVSRAKGKRLVLDL